MDWTFAIAMVIGIAPALVLMFAGVRNYTYPKVKSPFFSDASFFMLFVVGMVEGSIMFLVMRVFTTSSVENMILMILLAVVHLMIFVVTMNLKRYRGKSDSVFYGFALGLGNSCGLSAGLCYLIYATAASSETGVDASVVSLVFIAVSMAMLFGACGTTVGEGIARHRVMEFGLQAMLLMVAYYILLAAVVSTGDSVMFYVYLVLMIVLGVVYYYRVMCMRLPGIIREVLRMEGKRRSDIPKRSRSVESGAHLVREPAVEHGGEHPLRPGPGELLQVLQGEPAVDRGEAVGQDLHLPVQVPGVLVAVGQRRAGVGLLDPAPLRGRLLRVGAVLVRPRGPRHCLPDLGLVVGLVERLQSRGAVGASAPGAGRLRLGEVGYAGPEAHPAPRERVRHLYSAKTRAETQHP